MPNGNEVGVESYGKANTTELITLASLSVSHIQLLLHSFNLPISRPLCSFSPMAINCTLVQKSGPEDFGTLNVQLPPFILRRSSQIGWNPCLKRYMDSRILIFSTGVLLLYRQKSWTLSIWEPSCSRVASYVPSFLGSFCCLRSC